METVNCRVMETAILMLSGTEAHFDEVWVTKKADKRDFIKLICYWLTCGVVLDFAYVRMCYFK